MQHISNLEEPIQLEPATLPKRVLKVHHLDSLAHDCVSLFSHWRAMHYLSCIADTDCNLSEFNNACMREYNIYQDIDAQIKDILTISPEIFKLDTHLSSYWICRSLEEQNALCLLASHILEHKLSFWTDTKSEPFQLIAVNQNILTFKHVQPHTDLTVRVLCMDSSSKCTHTCIEPDNQAYVQYNSTNMVYHHGVTDCESLQAFVQSMSKPMPMCVVKLTEDVGTVQPMVSWEQSTNRELGTQENTLIFHIKCKDKVSDKKTKGHSITGLDLFKSMSSTHGRNTKNKGVVCPVCEEYSSLKETSPSQKIFHDLVPCKDWLKKARAFYNLTETTHGAKPDELDLVDTKSKYIKSIINLAVTQRKKVKSKKLNADKQVACAKSKSMERSASPPRKEYESYWRSNTQAKLTDSTLKL